jgi:hypothetical protein
MRRETKVVEKYCWGVTLATEEGGDGHFVTNQVPVCWSFDFSWTKFNILVHV